MWYLGILTCNSFLFSVCLVSSHCFIAVGNCINELPGYYQRFANCRGISGFGFFYVKRISACNILPVYAWYFQTFLIEVENCINELSGYNQLFANCRCLSVRMLEPEEIVQNDKLGEYVQNLLVKRCGPAIALYMWGICQLSHINR